MIEEILNWMIEENIELQIEDEMQVYFFEDGNKITFSEDNFKISKHNETSKWYFGSGKQKKFSYSEENIKILKEFLSETKSIDNEKYIYSQENISVREIPSQTGFQTLINMFEKNMFIIPENQRNYVWSKDKVENLAISLVRGLPIPPIYVYRNEKNQLVVLDGQQRLMSLFLYSKGEYISPKLKNKSISLKEDILTDNYGENMENQIYNRLKEQYTLSKVSYQIKDLDGKAKDINYKTLPSNIKALVDTRTITIIEIMVLGTEEKGEIYYNIFGNLNQGGVPLTNQELRNGIYRSNFYDMLHEVNDEEKWRTIFGTRHNRERDTELLLRFLATDYMFEFKDNTFTLGKHIKGNHKIDEYKDSYSKMLNDFSTIGKSFSLEEVEEYKNKLITFFDKVKLKSKDSKRTPRRPFNLLLESLYVVYQKIGRDFDITSDLMDRILKDKDYQDSTHAASSSRKNVMTRLNSVYNITLKYLEEKDGI